MRHRLFQTRLQLFILFAVINFIGSVGIARSQPNGTRRGPFTVQSYLGKCLTYSPEKGVYSYECYHPPTGILLNGVRLGYRPTFRVRRDYQICPNCALPILSQEIVVEEIDPDHEVRLHAGDKVIGVNPLFMLAKVPLELQDIATSPEGAKAQTFALDGDSIILAANRSLVVAIQNARGTNFTPLVLETRSFNDGEFWDFVANDGSAIFPTTGFSVVIDEPQFDAALSSAGRNSVIVVDKDASILLSKVNGSGAAPIKIIQDELTIRGGRRMLVGGGELKTCKYTDAGCSLSLSNVLDLAANYLRITGLRVTGPSLTRDQIPLVVSGLLLRDPYPPPQPQHIMYIDHNEISGWTVAGVSVEMGGDNGTDGTFQSWACSEHIDRPFANVHVIANYFHNNQRDEEGYGVVLASNGYAEIKGNTFSNNRHAIAADGTASSGYAAWYNLVTSSTEQDFDMHGSDSTTHHFGGIGGGQVEISENTFLRVSEHAFVLRGQACGLDGFENNVVVNRSAANSVFWYLPVSQSAPCLLELQQPEPHMSSCGKQQAPPTAPPNWFRLPKESQFNLPDPTNQLATGDFDGDGHDDLFLATGTAWYYSPAGQREWRFLSSHREPIGQLLFGDFDNDGRTDVVTKQGRQWLVSWGGISLWEVLNSADTSDDDVTHYAVGHFTSAHNTDLFHATGSQWLISTSGTAAFSVTAASTYQIKQLRFGDFDHDGRTDVLGVEGGSWRIVSGGAGHWSSAPINVRSMSNSVDGLIIADFDGDNSTDVARADNGGEFSSGGSGPWQPLRNSANQSIDLSNPAAPPGRFTGVFNAEVLKFDNNQLQIMSLAYPTHEYSCCDIR